MAKFKSPGVFFEEIDQSFLEEPAEGVGASFIGTAKKGPAFVPVRVGSFANYVNMFGNLDPNSEMPYAAKNYLKNATSLNVVRVLGHADGTDATPGYSVGAITGIADGSGSDAQILAIIHHSGTSTALSVSGTADSDRFIVSIGSFAATASFLTSSADYIEKVLNTDPTRYDTDDHYLYSVYKYAEPAASASWHGVAFKSDLNSFEKNFEGGLTPWVKSQLLGGNEYELFKFHTIGHGRSTNDDVKVSIQNIKPSANPNSSPWGTFDVVVRKFYDKDIRMETL